MTLLSNVKMESLLEENATIDRAIKAFRRKTKREIVEQETRIKAYEEALEQERESKQMELSSHTIRLDTLTEDIKLLIEFQASMLNDCDCNCSCDE